MKGYEIARKMAYVDKTQKCFIKWWRKENDFADYEEISTFLENLNPDHEFAGFELLTMEEMWQELKRVEPKRVTLDKQRGESVIRWQQRTRDGQLREEIYPYDPHTLMVIFDHETRGDTFC